MLKMLKPGKMDKIATEMEKYRKDRLSGNGIIERNNSILNSGSNK